MATLYVLDPIHHAPTLGLARPAHARGARRDSADVINVQVYHDSDHDRSWSDALPSSAHQISCGTVLRIAKAIVIMTRPGPQENR